MFPTVEEVDNLCNRHWIDYIAAYAGQYWQFVIATAPLLVALYLLWPSTKQNVKS